MHTSSILKAEDFEFWGYSDEGPVQMECPRLCPGYAETDRVAIVSPWFEDGVVNVPLAILSMATAFYDVQRARGTEFFDYPRHFALVGATNGRRCVRGEEEGPDSAQVGPPKGPPLALLETAISSLGNPIKFVSSDPLKFRS